MQRFQRIHDTNLWGAEASTSGLGSEIDATAALRAFALHPLVGSLGAARALATAAAAGTPVTKYN